MISGKPRDWRTKPLDGAMAEDLWGQYQLLKRQFKYACQKARKKSWEEFTSEANKMPLAARLNKIIRQKSYRTLGSLRKPDGGFTDSLQESHLLLMNKHFQGAILLGNNLPPDPAPMPALTEEAILIEPPDWISNRRVNDALVSFGNNKAPGPDGIKPVMLSHLPDNAKALLAKIFSASIALHYTPVKWRKSYIVFIPKPGKTDHACPRAYRPISLMSFLFKTLECLVQWRLEENSSPYHRNQHAFRKGHCTEHALSHMTDLAERALFKGHVCLAVFLDIQGAFDTLSSTAIASGMRSHGLENDLTQWFTKYLQH
jgi:hypothetical protein